mmetsp:Transcript_14199/g.25079  ORF Transcript_14199/g.25079 Transcript_14199/m.25079 type:complete len:389 (-) Transcript_14199:20-1186(-)
MVLSERWQVSEQELNDYVDALKNGQAPSPKLSPREEVKLPAGTRRRCPQHGLSLSAATSSQLSYQDQRRQSPGRSDASGSSLTSTPRRSNHKFGGSVRLDLLRKEDTIPCVHNGLRHRAADSELIRIYVKMPAIQATIALWVDPNLPIHPGGADAAKTFKVLAQAAEEEPAAAHKKSSGSDAEDEPPTARRGTRTSILRDEAIKVKWLMPPEVTRESPRRESPRRVLASTGRATLSAHPSPRERGETPVMLREAASLQDVIAHCTGVPANRQHLRAGAVRLDLNAEAHPPLGSTLRTCNINHGGSVLLNSANLDVHHRLVDQAHRNCTGGPWVMPRWEHSHNPKIIGQFPNDGYLSTQNIFYHNYCVLPELGATDPCDTIRGGPLFQM